MLGGFLRTLTAKDFDYSSASDSDAAAAAPSAAPRARRTPFLGFRARVARIDVSPFVPTAAALASGARSTASERADIVAPHAAAPDAGAESFFAAALARWREFDGSLAYAAAWRELAPLAPTLPLLLFNRARVVDALLRHLAEPHTLARRALLDLLTHLARDLRGEFYPFFRPVVLFLAGTLLDPRDTAALEEVFTALSYLFKFCQRQLLADIHRVLAWYAASLLAHRKPFVRKFAAESAGFLLRKVPEADVPAVVATLFAALLGDPATCSNTPAGASENDETAQGEHHQIQEEQQGEEEEEEEEEEDNLEVLEQDVFDSAVDATATAETDGTAEGEGEGGEGETPSAGSGALIESRMRRADERVRRRLRRVQRTQDLADGIAMLLAETVRGSRGLFAFCMRPYLDALLAYVAAPQPALRADDAEGRALALFTVWETTHNMQLHVRATRNSELWPVLERHAVALCTAAALPPTAAAPERVLANDALELVLAVAAEWIEWHTGAAVPRVAAARTCAAALGALLGSPARYAAAGPGVRAQALRVLRALAMLEDHIATSSDADDDDDSTAYEPQTARLFGLVLANTGRELADDDTAPRGLETLRAVCGLVLTIAHVDTELYRDVLKDRLFAFLAALVGPAPSSAAPSSAAAAPSTPRKTPRKKKQEQEPLTISGSTRFVVEPVVLVLLVRLATDARESGDATAARAVAIDDRAVVAWLARVLADTDAATLASTPARVWAAFRVVPLTRGIDAGAVKRATAALFARVEAGDAPAARQAAFDAFRALCHVADATRADDRALVLRTCFALVHALPDDARALQACHEQLAAVLAGADVTAAERADVAARFGALAQRLQDNARAPSSALRLHTAALLRVLAPSAAVADVLDLVCAIERTPIDVPHMRDITTRIETIERRARARSLPAEIAVFVGCYLLGTYYIKFQPVWEFTTRALKLVVRANIAAMWPILVNQLRRSEVEVYKTWFPTSAAARGSLPAAGADTGAQTEEEEEEMVESENGGKKRSHESLKEKRDNNGSSGEDEEDNVETASKKQCSNEAKEDERNDTKVEESCVPEQLARTDAVMFADLDEVFAAETETVEVDRLQRTDPDMYNKLVWEMVESLADYAQKHSDEVLECFLVFMKVVLPYAFRFMPTGLKKSLEGICRDLDVSQLQPAPRSSSISSTARDSGDDGDEGDEGDDDSGDVFDDEEHSWVPYKNINEKMERYMQFFARLPHPELLPHQDTLFRVLLYMLENKNVHTQELALTAVLQWHKASLQTYAAQLAKLVKSKSMSDQLSKFQVFDRATVREQARHDVSEVVMHILYPRMFKLRKSHNRTTTTRAAILAYFANYAPADLAMVVDRILYPLEHRKEEEEHEKKQQQKQQQQEEMKDEEEKKKEEEKEEKEEEEEVIVDKHAQTHIRLVTDFVEELSVKCEPFVARFLAVLAPYSTTPSTAKEAGGVRTAAFRALTTIFALFDDSKMASGEQRLGVAAVAQFLDSAAPTIARSLHASRCASPPAVFGCLLAMADSDALLALFARNSDIYPGIVSYVASTHTPLAFREEALTFVERVVEARAAVPEAAALLQRNAGTTARALCGVLQQRNNVSAKYRRVFRRRSGAAGGDAAHALDGVSMEDLKRRAVVLLESVAPLVRGARDAMDAANALLRHVAAFGAAPARTDIMALFEARDGDGDTAAALEREQTTNTLMRLAETLLDAAGAAAREPGFVAYVGGLFGTVAQHSAREALCRIYTRATADDPQMAPVARVVSDLNAYTTGNVADDYDYERRQHAVDTLLQLGSEGKKEEEGEEEGVLKLTEKRQFAPLVTNLLFYTTDEDRMIREGALAALGAVFREMAALIFPNKKKSSNEEEKEEDNVETRKDLAWYVRENVVPQVIRGVMRSQDASVVASLQTLKLLGVVFPTMYPDLAALSRGAPSFFDGYSDISAEKRAKGLRAFCAAGRAGELDVERCRCVWLPLFSKHLLAEHAGAFQTQQSKKRSTRDMQLFRSSMYHTLNKEVVLGPLTDAIAACHAAFGWNAYYDSLNAFVKVVDKEPELAQLVTPVLCKIIDVFHFDVMAARPGIDVAALRREIAARHRREAAQMLLLAGRGRDIHGDDDDENEEEEEDEHEEHKGESDEENEGKEGGEMEEREAEEDSGDAVDRMMQEQELAERLEQLRLAQPEPVQVRLALTERLIPLVFEKLRAAREVVLGEGRVLLARAAVRLILLLPGCDDDAANAANAERRPLVSQLLLLLCQSLREQDEAVRAEARQALRDVCRKLGLSYYPLVFRLLRTTLPRKGFCLHVLGYTLNTVLHALAAALPPRERLVGADGAPGPVAREIDRVAEDTSQVLLDDLIGLPGRQKRTLELRNKMVEMGPSTAVDSYAAFARLVSIGTPADDFGGAGRLLLPIIGAARTAASAVELAPKELADCLRRVLRDGVAPGLLAGPGASIERLLPFAYLLVKNNVTLRNTVASQELLHGLTAAEAAAKLRRERVHLGGRGRGRGRGGRGGRDRYRGPRNGVQGHAVYTVIAPDGVEPTIDPRVEAEINARKRFLLEARPSPNRPAESVVGENASAGFLLAEFGIGLVDAVLGAPGKLDWTSRKQRAMLDPFVALLADCLNDTHASVANAALDVLAHLLEARGPGGAPAMRLLPGLEACAPRIIAHTVGLVDAHTLSNAESALQTFTKGFDLVATLLRCGRDCAFVADPARARLYVPPLLRLVAARLERPADLTPALVRACFGLLNVIVARRLECAAVYDIVDRVTVMSVTTTIDNARAQAVRLVTNFLVAYPQTDRRRRQTLEFYLKNLDYAAVPGRQAVLAVLDGAVTRLPAAELDRGAEELFLALVARLHNEDEHAVKDAIARVLRDLFRALDDRRAAALLALTHAWLRNSADRDMQRLALQLCTIVADCGGPAFWRKFEPALPLVRELMAAAATQLRHERRHGVVAPADPAARDGDGAAWLLLYHALLAVEKVLAACPAFLNGAPALDDAFWTDVCVLTHYRHAWVQAVCLRLLGLLFSQNSPEAVAAAVVLNADAEKSSNNKNEKKKEGKKGKKGKKKDNEEEEKKGEEKDEEGEDGTVTPFLRKPKSLVLLQKTLLDSLEDSRSDQGADQLLRDLVFLCRVCLADPRVRVSTRQADNEPYGALAHVVARAANAVPDLAVPLRCCVYKLFAAVATLVPAGGALAAQLLPAMLPPLYRSVNDIAHESAAQRRQRRRWGRDTGLPRVVRTDAAERALADEVLGVLKQAAGERAYLDAYGAVRRAHADEVAALEKRRRQLAVTDPARAAQLKRGADRGGHSDREARAIARRRRFFAALRRSGDLLRVNGPLPLRPRGPSPLERARRHFIEQGKMRRRARSRIRVTTTSSDFMSAD